MKKIFIFVAFIVSINMTGCVKGNFIGTSVSTAISDQWGIVYFMTNKGDTLPIVLLRDLTVGGSNWELATGTPKIGDTIRETGGFPYRVDSVSFLVRK